MLMNLHETSVGVNSATDNLKNHHHSRYSGKERLRFIFNWLRVLGTAELTQIDQRVRHQLHAIVPLLDAFKAEQ